MDFANLVQTAFFDGTAARGQAEKQLVEYRNQNVVSFFEQCVDLLKDNQKSSNIRQAAGTLIKGSAPILNPQGNQLWFQITPENRNRLKGSLCQTLMTTDMQARKASADAISTIVTLEVPRGEWTEFISKLVENVSHQNQEIVSSSVMTLGLICEKFKDFKNSNLESTVQQKILQGICLGLDKQQQNDNIKIESLKALRDSLYFLDKLMENEQITTFVATLLVENCQHQNPNVKIEALQCCGEWVKLNYMRLGQYIHGILTGTQSAINDSDEAIAIAAMEVWTTIAVEYKDLNAKQQDMLKQAHQNSQQQLMNIPNHMQAIYQQLIPSVIKNLTVVSQDIDEAESTVQEATLRCLGTIVETIGDSLITFFTNYISNQFASQKWEDKQAGVLAFTALIDGVSGDEMKKLLYSGISHFVQYLKDPSPQFKESVGKLLSRSAELHSECFLNNQNLAHDIQVMLSALLEKPNISRHICWIFCFLSEDLPKYPDSHLNQKADHIIKQLMTNGIRADIEGKDISLIDCSFMGIMNLLQKCTDKSVALNFLELTISQFSNTYDIPITRRASIQSGIMAAQHAALLSIQEQFTTIERHQAIANDLYQNVRNHFIKNGDVDSDSIYVMSALATSLREDFKFILNDFYPYLHHGLQKINDAEMFKTSIGCLADVARACKEDFVPKLDIMNSLIGCLKTPSFDRELKLHVFVCIGDLFLACEKNCEPYVEQLLEIFNLAYSACITTLKSGNPDNVEYAENLQEKMVEAFTCILHGINSDEGQPSQSLKKGFQPLIEFLKQSTDKTVKPTIDYVRQTLTIIIDIYNFYSKEVAHIVRQPFVSELMEVMRKFSQNNSENAQCYDYAFQVHFQFTKQFHKIFNNQK